MIDATHPYADQISANAVAACKRTGVPLASLVRAAWLPQQGDAWQSVPTTQAAADALGPDAAARVPEPRPAGTASLCRRSRSTTISPALIDPPQQTTLPPDLVLLQQRGPFDRAAELRLFKDEKIDVIVSKNSGGAATYPKIEAARELGLPVIMIARPDKPAGHVVTSAEEAMAWLAHDGARSPRGV